MERDDFLAERDKSRSRHLEARDAERDANDREAQEDAGEQVTEGEPPAREDEPQTTLEAAPKEQASSNV